MVFVKNEQEGRIRSQGIDWLTLKKLHEEIEPSAKQVARGREEVELILESAAGRQCPLLAQADIQFAPVNVRFRRQSGHVKEAGQCLLLIRSRPRTPFFDHLVGERKQR
jgi:hypothetical protein